MRRTVLPTLGAALVASLGFTPGEARAEDPPLAHAPPPLAARSFAARGPLALSLAGEPRALHWSLESGLPLRGMRREAAGRPRAGIGSWRLDALVRASHDHGEPARGAGLGYALRLEHEHTRSAHWLGSATGGSRAQGEPESRVHLGAGHVHELGPLQFEATWIASSVLFRDDPRWPRLQSFRYFVPGDSAGDGVFIDSTVALPGDHAALWNTAQGSLRWQHGRLALASVGGLSLGEGVRARRWAQVSAEWQLARHVMLLASYGVRPVPSLAFRGDAHPRTMLGIQVAPWAATGWAMSGAVRPGATAWRTRVLPGDLLLVRVRCRDVSHAEIAGDFTDWRPVPLLRQRGGWWEGVVRVPPGVHRVQLRLDGGSWMAPPGLPRADDGPAGPSGTLVVTAEE